MESHFVQSPPSLRQCDTNFLERQPARRTSLESAARACVCVTESVNLFWSKRGGFRFHSGKFRGILEGWEVKSIRRREHFKRFNKSFFFADTKGWLGRFLPLSGVTGNATWLGPHYSGLSLLWRHQPPRLKVVEARRRKYRCLLSNVEGKKKKKVKSGLRTSNIHKHLRKEKKKSTFLNPPGQKEPKLRGWRPLLSRFRSDTPRFLKSDSHKSFSV